jgi:protein-disulfide isomerase
MNMKKLSLVAKLSLAIILMFFKTCEFLKAEEIKNYSANKSLELRSDDFIIGDKNAKIVVIEYSSVSCPHCSEFHKYTYKEFKKKYIDTGLVKYVYRDFPTNEPALLGALTAHCAGKDKYYLYISTLMDSQSTWAYNNNYKESLINIAKLGGISEEKIKSCLSNKESQDKMLKSVMDDAIRLEMTFTPTFFINDNKHAGAKSINELSKIIDAELSKKVNHG